MNLLKVANGSYSSVIDPSGLVPMMTIYDGQLGVVGNAPEIYHSVVLISSAFT